MEDFSNLRILSRLFAFDEWKDIKDHIENLFNININTNPLYADKAAIEVTKGKVEDGIITPEKWFNYRNFTYYLKSDGKQRIATHYRAWRVALSSESSHSLWRKDVFKSIGEYIGGLEEIAQDTLNLIDCSKARFQVRKNLCGFLLGTIQIKNTLELWKK